MCTSTYIICAVGVYTLSTLFTAIIFVVVLLILHMAKSHS